MKSTPYQIIYGDLGINKLGCWDYLRHYVVYQEVLCGYWEFPGGKIEEDENPKDSLARELLEELDMEVEIMEYFMTNMHNYDRFSIELIAYKCIFKKSSFTLVDHDVYKWVDVKSLDKIKMAPADIPIAKKLVFF